MKSTSDEARSGLPHVVFVTSHPIQYQVPVFRHLAERHDLDFQILLAMLPDATAQGTGQGVRFEWDIPLLDGPRQRPHHCSRPSWSEPLSCVQLVGDSAETIHLAD